MMTRLFLKYLLNKIKNEYLKARERRQGQKIDILEDMDYLCKVDTHTYYLTHFASLKLS
jgi:hypothetical protein